VRRPRLIPLAPSLTSQLETRDKTHLLQHSQLLEQNPILDNLAVGNSGEEETLSLDPSIGRPVAQVDSPMCAEHRPPGGPSVAFFDLFLNRAVQI
jgi:hypothetical protein